MSTITYDTLKDLKVMELKALASDLDLPLAGHRRKDSLRQYILDEKAGEPLPADDAQDDDEDSDDAEGLAAPADLAAHTSGAPTAPLDDATSRRRAAATPEVTWVTGAPISEAESLDVDRWPRDPWRYWEQAQAHLLKGVRATGARLDIEEMFQDMIASIPGIASPYVRAGLRATLKRCLKRKLKPRVAARAERRAEQERYPDELREFMADYRATEKEMVKEQKHNHPHPRGRFRNPRGNPRSQQPKYYNQHSYQDYPQAPKGGKKGGWRSGKGNKGGYY
eukprot:TRINITY_DN7632_c0_g1_i5.p2 TRINITY_DN7632_c0_g1~~TRINITY_DN7632_c0_g1_i5.p2  ORF type:complete len:280 (-),score=29.73 TRINITY_DN7632_c0_g1_i5:2137-2976(-)